MPCIDVCSADEIEREDLIRWDNGDSTFAIYFGTECGFSFTDELCTHGKVHVADRLVMDDQSEYPKHIGPFDFRSGRALDAPVCEDLVTSPAKFADGLVLMSFE
jgi:3-phenylpropionate/trans-cinnamate dioxygenase ferredoxin subunit